MYDTIDINEQNNYNNPFVSLFLRILFICVFYRVDFFVKNNLTSYSFGVKVDDYIPLENKCFIK